MHLATRPTTSATSDPIAQLGMSRRAGLHLADDRTDLGAGPIAGPAQARLGSCRCRPRECARLPSAHRGAPPLAAHPNGTTTTATATCTDPDAMQPRFPVNDRAPGTALGLYLAGNRPGSASTRLMTAGCPATSRVRPAFNPTVGGVTGTSPRYGNRNRRRTSRPDLRAHPRGPRQGQGLGPQARAPERLAGRLTARRQEGGDPSLPRTGRVQGPRRQDHRRLPADPLQLHEHPRAQAESFLRSAPFGALRVTESSSLRTVN